LSFLPLAIVTATSLEYRITRAELPSANVINAGVALRALPEQTFDGSVISCGLAGGLREGLPTGTVVIPDRVQRPDGVILHCDASLVRALRKGAHALSLPYTDEPMVTSHEILRGTARSTWAARGFIAADMETGLLRAPRMAAVRVILDTPGHELHAAWLHPATLILHPRAWLELPWLARQAPRCARLAARVLARALEFIS